MSFETFKTKKNLAIIGAVCLVCIAFVVGTVRRDKSVTEETVSPAETAETEEIETEAESTAVEVPEPERRIFSRPASSLKEIAGEDTEEYVPAPFRLNLAYFYPEDADTSDSIHSYAGKIFQTLNTLNADYLANYYDMSDMTPLSFAGRKGQGAERIMGKYNPQDSRHDPKDPSTWKINSFRNVTVNFYDGDGNRINGYYAVQEIMSMASVYAYYHDMDDAEAMENYCRELFKNAMSSRVSMGSVYYDSGCLNRTKQDEAAEAIAMEAQQLATEHQLAGATALSSGLQELIGVTDAAIAAGTTMASGGNIDGLPAAGADGALTGENAAGDLSADDNATTGSTITDASPEDDGDDVVVSHAVNGTTDGSTSGYAVVSSDSAHKDQEKPSYAVYNGEGLGGKSYSEIMGSQDPDPDVVISAGENDDAPAEEPASDASAEVMEEISAVPADIAEPAEMPESAATPDAGEDVVVSPAAGIMNLRKITGLLRRPFMRTASAGYISPVYHLADEDMVVSPGASADPAAAEVVSDAPPVAADVSADPVQEPAAPAVSDATQEAIPEETPSAAETGISGDSEASDGDSSVQESVSSASETNGESAMSENAGSSSAIANSYGYAVVGSGGRTYSNAEGSIPSADTAESVPQTAETQEAEELSEEEAAIAAQINELLAQANVLSGAESYCPGHIDLYITITIKGIDDRNGLFKVDKIGNDKANFNDRWQGWTTDKIAEARALNHQDWFETYGLSISSINLTSQLTEEEIQEYLNTLPEDVSDARKAVVDFALHSVGKVPYYWGGKPNGPGYEGNNFYSLIGADYHGRILRGLDCSGWVNWVYWSATGSSLAGESTGSLIGCGRRISRSALRPGDIIIRTGADSHVVMFLGWVGNGNFIGIHETGGVKNNVVVGEMTASWPYYRSLLD